MKKILGLTIVALIVMGLVGGGTWAYFSDTETSSGNTFGAGTLDLKVQTENPLVSTLISLGNMYPGQTTSNVTIAVENVGTLPGDLYMRITGVTDSGGTSLGPNGTSSEPEYVAESGTFIAGVAQNDNTPNNSISANLTAGVAWSGITAVTNLDGVTLASANNTWSGNFINLAASGSDTIEFNAVLNSLTGNEYQGDNTTFAIEFYLAQDGQGSP
ncbi:TasA family protein [Chloroflexota bacterium]